MGTTPRLRLFAGPNGSGKSTIQDVIPSHYKGVYLNPDDIERDARASGVVQNGEQLGVIRRHLFIHAGGFKAAEGALGVVDDGLKLELWKQSPRQPHLHPLSKYCPDSGLALEIGQAA